MNPLIVLVVGLILLYVGVTGRAESVWQGLTKGGRGGGGRPAQRGGRVAPRR